MVARSKLRALYTRNRRDVLLSTVALVAVVIVGSILVLTKAAGSVVSSEVESGTKSAQATTVADTTASGGSAVKFSAPVTGGTDVCATFPTLPSAKPDATNTGVPAGTNLTAYTGPTTITTAGTIIDGKDISGGLTISANNVTIKNSLIHVTSNSTETVTVTGSFAKILHSEVSSSAGSLTGITLQNTDATVCATHIHGFENGITVVANNAIIQANYIHNLLSDNPAAAHPDGIELYSGNNTKVYGNTVFDNDVNGAWYDRTSAVNLTTEYGNITGDVFNGNWLGGGSFTMYVTTSSASNGYNWSNVTVTNNRFIRNSWQYGPALIRPGAVTQSGNVYDDNGQALTL